MKVLVLGGTGFVGRHLCEQLCRAGHRITVPTRRAVQARHIQHLPTLTVVEADVHNAQALQSLVRGHDAVVNLVAILHGKEAQFERAHVRLPGLLVQACQAEGVRRVVHVSAIGADPQGPSMYQRSKGRGEQVLLASGLDVTLLRPSVIFADDDHFTQMFAKLQTLFPVMPLAGSTAQFQPVWVQDVAQALCRLLHAPLTQRADRVVEACGPQVLTLAQIVRLCGLRCGHPRPIIPLPEWAAFVQAGVMECLPGPPLMSRDNVRSMRQPNVASGQHPGLDSLGIRPRALTA